MDGKPCSLRLLSSSARLKEFYCTGLPYHFQQNTYFLHWLWQPFFYHGQPECPKTHTRYTWTCFTLCSHCLKSHQLWRAIPSDSFQMTSQNAGWHTAVNEKWTFNEHNTDSTQVSQMFSTNQQHNTIDGGLLLHFYFHCAQRPDTLFQVVCGFPQSLQTNATHYFKVGDCFQPHFSEYLRQGDCYKPHFSKYLRLGNCFLPHVTVQWIF